jgi:hypothetical protein
MTLVWRTCGSSSAPLKNWNSRPSRYRGHSPLSTSLSSTTITTQHGSCIFHPRWVGLCVYFDHNTPLTLNIRNLLPHRGTSPPDLGRYRPGTQLINVAYTRLFWTLRSRSPCAMFQRSISRAPTSLGLLARVLHRPSMSCGCVSGRKLTLVLTHWLLGLLS